MDSCPSSERVELERPRRRVLRAAGVAAALFSAAGCSPNPPSGAPSLEQQPQRFDPSQAIAEDPSAFSNEAAESGPLPLINAPARRTRTIAAMMFDIGMGPPDKTQIQNLLTGTNSLQKMYQEISYGMQDLDIELLGPYTLDQHVCLPIECCGPKSSQPNGPQVQGIIAGYTKKYDHYFWVYGGAQNISGCGTWGDEGTPGRYAVYSSYSFHQLVGYAQELGHNFGMTHEPIMTCPSKAVFMDDPTQCTHKEYGTNLSFMGNGAHHVSAYHAVAQGWLSKCNGVKVGGAGGKYNLLPLETPCDGTQVIQVKAPKSRAAPAKGDRQGSAPTLTHYYLELRTPVGFDSKVGPMVVVSIGPEFDTTRSAPYVYVLDQTPGDSQGTANGGLTAGQTFTDPAGGVSFTVSAIDNTHAEVTITGAGTGSDTCLDGSAFTLPGPDATACVAIGSGGGAGGGTSTTGGSSSTGGSGGKAGTGGSGGKGGASGGGSGGASGGTGGKGNTGGGGSGSAGKGNTGGSNAGGSSGGASGMAGTTGGTTGGMVATTGGVPTTGTGGAPGFGGNVGAGSGGLAPTTGGASPSTGGQVTLPPSDAGNDSGCSCTVPARPAGGNAQLIALLGAALAFTRRRQRPQRSR
jgi:MYXO-CTERM domain-containing protein